MDVTERIRNFIREELLFEDVNRELTDETPLLGNDLIDSLGLMELVAFLEREFEVEIDDADIKAEHFRTVADIAALVERRIGQKQAASG